MILQQEDILVVYHYDHRVIFSGCCLGLNGDIIALGSNNEEFELNDIYSINGRRVNYN